MSSIGSTGSRSRSATTRTILPRRWATWRRRRRSPTSPSSLEAWSTTSPPRTPRSSSSAAPTAAVSQPRPFLTGYSQPCNPLQGMHMVNMYLPCDADLDLSTYPRKISHHCYYFTFLPAVLYCTFVCPIRTWWWANWTRSLCLWVCLTDAFCLQCWLHGSGSSTPTSPWGHRVLGASPAVWLHNTLEQLLRWHLTGLQGNKIICFSVHRVKRMEFIWFKVTASSCIWRHNFIKISAQCPR